MTVAVPSRAPASRWIVDFTPDRRPAVTLLCLPHAGGGANAYRGWPAAMPPSIGIAAVQLPGRERRFDESALADMAAVVERLTPTVVALAAAGPIALFGHSMGAAMAWELARALRMESGEEPCHLMVAGRRAPGLPSLSAPLHSLPDEAFRQALGRLGGTPPEILADDELMGLMLPMLRGDFTLIETWRPMPGLPLSCPVTTFAGADDSGTTPSCMSGWGRMTTGPVSHHVLPGGHFFLDDSRDALLRLIVSTLTGG